MEEEKKESGFNREDPAGTKMEESYKNFVKDKRKRIDNTGSGKVEYRPKEYTPRDGSEGDEPWKRRSYNPNFTRDNRPVGEKREYTPRDGYEKREYTPRDGYVKREYTPREGGERREYTPRGDGEKPRYGENRSYGDRPSYGQRREYTPRDGEERREHTPREGGQRREYTPRGDGERPRYGDKRPYGDRPSYGQKREYTPRDGGERREYTPRGDGERPRYGDKRPYGDKPSYGQKREYTPRDGGERREYTPRGNGERPRYGESRPYGDRPSQGDRPSYNRNREQGTRGEHTGRRPGQGNNNRNDGRGGGYTPRFTADNYPTFPAPPIEDKIRLNRYISMSGICSRREADEFITSGVVTVNGEVVTELGAKVSADDVVKFNNNLIQNEKKVYIVMNKPKGYVTSVEDPHADKTVMELLNNGCRERVYPVGRLDKNSLGVLLITNDGDLAKKLTHPSFEKKKVYQVTLDKPLTKADMQAVADGVTLDDGEVHADAISYVGEKKTEIGIEIHSGRNRIVRRIFEHLGYRVQKLDRVYFAGLTKQRLKRGAWRFLSPREVQNLLSGRYE